MLFSAIFLMKSGMELTFLYDYDTVINIQKHLRGSGSNEKFNKV